MLTMLFTASNNRQCSVSTISKALYRLYKDMETLASVFLENCEAIAYLRLMDYSSS